MTIPRLILLVPAFSLSFAQGACAPTDGGQVGEETVVCQPVASQMLDAAEASPLGFSPDDLLANVAGMHQVELRWADGANTELTAELTLTGAATFHDREWVDTGSGGGAEPAIEPAPGDCPDIVELEMLLAFATGDGAFNESWPIRLQATAADSATAYQALETLTGTLNIADYAPADEDFDALYAHLDLEFVLGELGGTVEGLAEASDGNAVSAAFFAIAEFGDEAGE